MLEFQNKLKRQVEILGLCLDTGSQLQIADLADYFRIEELTIKRDLHELRSSGIDVHSVKQSGVRLAGSLSQRQLRDLILQYLSFCHAGSAADKATTLLVKRLRDKALSSIVILQLSIERRRNVVIDYQKDAEIEERNREVSPLLIFQSEGSWRVLAIHDGRMKQYHLNKLLAVRATVKSFKAVPQEQIDDMFKYSFRSWIGTEQFRVCIHLSKLWATRIKPRQLMETQSIVEMKDGSVMFEAIVNSLDEIASWVVSRGEGVTVIEPEELKKRVIEIANGTLKNYLKG